MGLTDLHIHSTYSDDATTTVRGILRQAADIGLDVICITDHDQIRGSLEAREMASKYNMEAIPGAEVSTSEGHLLGLFIEKLPPPGLSVVETLLRIGEQGGIAIAPHPFNRLPSSLGMQSVIGVLTKPRAKGILKGIEVHNMGTQAFDALVQKLSVYLPLARVASSDAHVYWAVGAGRTEFPGITAGDLREALENCTTVPIPFAGKFSAVLYLSWVRRMVLRRLGFSSDSTSISRPVDTTRPKRDGIKIKQG
jgi:predicted metal-dependent phosphoesterase TrpH